MNDILVDLGISALITLLKTYIPKTVGEKNKWKKVMLKIFGLIAQNYGDDPAFVESFNTNKPKPKAK